jgi:hypothetical protein
MEPFSSNEVASVLGVPLPATPPQEQLKTAKYAGLLSMEMEHRKKTILVNQFLEEMDAHTRTVLLRAVAGACGMVLGNSGNWGDCFCLSVLLAHITTRTTSTTTTTTTPDATRPSLSVKRTLGARSAVDLRTRGSRPDRKPWRRGRRE